MGRVYLCLGQNAELPYYFEKAKVHIWNIEELCYFIRENAWIMEPELLTKELIDWVAQQCGLPKLAVLLNDSLKEEDCVTAFAACLFSYTGYCPQEQALQVQKILQTNAGNNETDRAKARGDYFLESGKYFRALQEYEPLMKQLTGAKPEIVGSVYHNAGCAYAGLFLFDRAAAAYEKAWKLLRDKRSAAGFLAAKRMGLSEQEYVDFLAKNPELYQISLLVEEQLKDCRQKWQGTPGQAFCASIEGALQNGSGDICQKQLADKIKELEKEYREAVS